jgi:hypothetical protein
MEFQCYKKGPDFVASVEGGTMPINRLLKDRRTPKEIELLNKAFNHALNLLGVVDRNDPLCDMVARKVIEQNGVVERRFYSMSPPRAEYYVLTEKGRDLGPIVGAMRNWGRKYSS